MAVLIAMGFTAGLAWLISFVPQYRYNKRELERIVEEEKRNDSEIRQLLQDSANAEKLRKGIVAGSAKTALGEVVRDRMAWTAYQDARKMHEIINDEYRKRRP